MGSHAQSHICFGVLVDSLDDEDAHNTDLTEIVGVGDSYDDRVIVALRGTVIGGDHPGSFDPASLTVEAKKLARFQKYLDRCLPSAGPPRWILSGYWG